MKRVYMSDESVYDVCLRVTYASMRVHMRRVRVRVCMRVCMCMCM